MPGLFKRGNRKPTQVDLTRLKSTGLNVKAPKNVEGRKPQRVMGKVGKVVAGGLLAAVLGLGGKMAASKAVTNARIASEQITMAQGLNKASAPTSKILKLDPRKQKDKMILRTIESASTRAGISQLSFLETVRGQLVFFENGKFHGFNELELYKQKHPKDAERIDRISTALKIANEYKLDEIIQAIQKNNSKIQNEFYKSK